MLRALCSATLLRVLALCSLALVQCGWNERSRSACDPVEFPNDGDGYCTGRVEGWFNGGVADTWWSADGDVKTCNKWGKGCDCEDCGQGMTSCQDTRCNDVEGYLKYNYQTREEECFDIATDKKRRGDWFDYCYTAKAVCDVSVCKHGQYLAGCKRASPGICLPCAPPFLSSHFWGAVGNGQASCQQIACAVAEPGRFVKTACTATANADIRSCAEYPGNKKSLNDMSPEQIRLVNSGASGVFDVDRFYCPVGNLVLPLPANSIASSNYSAFECKPGFYLDDRACLPCPAGSACVGGTKMQCPVNYYSKNIASSCTRCTVSCNDNRKPLRCKAGSSYDGGCVGCGACGFSDDTGLACVENDYEMQSLKQTCVPNGSGGCV